jgi:hypothetical protein
MILFAYILGVLPCVRSQNIIYVRYVEPTIETPVKVCGYDFSTWKCDKFEIRDSLLYKWIKERIDIMELCVDTSCSFPDVRQQIIVVDGEKYDILSSDGSYAMEKNGKSVIFDKILQDKINLMIEKMSNGKIVFDKI